MVSENKSRHYKIDFPHLLIHAQWPAADFILKKLQSNGYEALIAGGAVRDLIMNRNPGDLDIATSAKPDEVEALFEQTVAVGKAFGVIRVIYQGHSIEVATYRKDLEYQDGRRPEGVVYTNRIEDAKRRDFTINALFYDPENKILYDDVDGKKDIEGKTLSCVGVAQERFQEDELRRLRLVRFVSQIGFTIESKTLKALETGIEGLQKISKERITEEIGKMWMGAFLPDAFRIWIQSGMAEQVDPAWKKESFLDFNLEPDQWQLPRQEKDLAWSHYFSFFFEESSLRKHFEAFRLPKETEKFVEAVHQSFQIIPQFLKFSFGEQRYRAAQKGFLLGFLYYISKKATVSERPRLLEMLRDFKLKGDLPDALIRAQHLDENFPGRYKGPELGAILKRVFIEQLEQGWTSSEQALTWIRSIK